MIEIIIISNIDIVRQLCVVFCMSKSYRAYYHMHNKPISQRFIYDANSKCNQDQLASQYTAVIKR